MSIMEQTRGAWGGGGGGGSADLYLHILGAGEDRVLTDGQGLDRLLVSLEGQDWQHVLQIPHLQRDSFRNI